MQLLQGRLLVVMTNCSECNLVCGLGSEPFNIEISIFYDRFTFSDRVFTGMLQGRYHSNRAMERAAAAAAAPLTREEARQQAQAEELTLVGWWPRVI